MTGWTTHTSSGKVTHREYKRRPQGWGAALWILALAALLAGVLAKVLM